ncbi:MAG: hypothetical protein NNA22_07575 [Nitrospira sp.]|nr:hypothetical protein [Nitrospira sp.]
MGFYRRGKGMMQGRRLQRPTPSDLRPDPRSAPRRGTAMVWALVFLAASAAASPVFAEVKTVAASGQHRMDKRDTKEDAIRLATEAAKRNALEQVATYVESVTATKGMDLTKDEIRTYTAGVVLVREQRLTISVDGETVVVKVDLLAEIDTEDVIEAIEILRKNEDARVQLAALKRETDRLRQELDRANRALVDAPMAEHAGSTARRREILYRVQSNAVLSQVWTDWALAFSGLSSVVSRGGLNTAHLLHLLQAAREFHPDNPHVGVAENKLAGNGRQSVARPSPPSMPAQGPGPMPRYELVPGPGSQGGARTLNEIVYRSPERGPSRANDSSVQSDLRPRLSAESDRAEKSMEGDPEAR